jgi:hypothetical protein
MGENPYEESAEPDAQCPQNTVHKIRLTRPIPDRLDVIAADAVNNLRAALDQAIYAIAAAAGSTISHAKFPFSGTAADLERAVAGKSTYLPQDILALLRTFQTYKGGNDLACALNDWCNIDKHALIVPAENAALHMRTSIHGTGFFSAPTKPSWDRSRHEIIMFTFGPLTEDVHYDFDFLFFISFDEIEAIRGREAIEVLYAMAGEVERILMALEAEAGRIGLSG